MDRKCKCEFDASQKHENTRTRARTFKTCWEQCSNWGGGAQGDGAPPTIL